MASGHNTLHRTSEHKAGLATADLRHEHEA